MTKHNIRATNTTPQKCHIILYDDTYRHKKVTHCLSGHTKRDKNKLSQNNVWHSGSSQKNCWKKSPPLILWRIVFYVTRWPLLCDGYSRHKIVPYVTAQHNCHKRSWHYMTTFTILSRHTFYDALFVTTRMTTGFRHNVFLWQFLYFTWQFALVIQS
jgi:hypothetical protein